METLGSVNVFVYMFSQELIAKFRWRREFSRLSATTVEICKKI